METTENSLEAIMRSAAWALIIGGLLGGIAMGLFPVVLDPELFQDERKLLPVIAGNSLLVWTHVLVMIAFGLLGIGISISTFLSMGLFGWTKNHPRPQHKTIFLSASAFVMGLISTILGISFMLVDGFGLAEMAMKYVAAPAAEMEAVYRSTEGLLAIDNALFAGCSLVFGATNILLGMCLKDPCWNVKSWNTHLLTFVGAGLLLTGLLYVALFFSADISFGTEDMSPYFIATSLNFLFITLAFFSAAATGWNLKTAYTPAS